MGRPASTISREVARNRCDAGGYEAVGAGSAARWRRRRGLVKLREGSALREHVITDIALRAFGEHTQLRGGIVGAHFDW